MIKKLGSKEKSAKPPPPLMRCVISTATNNPHPISIRVGERFPADHDLVRRWPWAFIADDQADYVGRDYAARYAVAEGDRGQAIADATEGKRRIEREKQEEALLRKPIPLERQRLCIRHAGAWGASAPMANWKHGEPMGIRAGEIADARWSLVKEFPERFVAILPKGLAVENAVVCIADEGVRQAAPDGSVGRHIRRGQMVAKDDPLVEINSAMFVPASSAGQVAGSRELIVVARPDQIVSDVKGPRAGSGYVTEGS